MWIVSLIVAVIVVNSYRNTQQGGERLRNQIGAQQMAMNDFIASPED